MSRRASRFSIARGLRAVPAVRPGRASRRVCRRGLPVRGVAGRCHAAGPRRLSARTGHCLFSHRRKLSGGIRIRRTRKHRPAFSCGGASPQPGVRAFFHLAWPVSRPLAAARVPVRAGRYCFAIFFKANLSSFA